jgi:hypothetical protein
MMLTHTLDELMSRQDPRVGTRAGVHGEGKKFAF